MRVLFQISPLYVMLLYVVLCYVLVTLFCYCHVILLVMLFYVVTLCYVMLCYFVGGNSYINVASFLFTLASSGTTARGGS